MMSWIIALLAATAGTYALRAGSVRAFSGRDLPAGVDRMLRHAAIAVMSAIAVASLPAGGVSGWTVATAFGIGVAIVLALRYSNIAAVTAAGVLAYWLAGALAR